MDAFDTVKGVTGRDAVQPVLLSRPFAGHARRLPTAKLPAVPLGGGGARSGIDYATRLPRQHGFAGMTLESVRILGVPVHSLDWEGALALVDAFVGSRTPHQIVT